MNKKDNKIVRWKKFLKFFEKSHYYYSSIIDCVIGQMGRFSGIGDWYGLGGEKFKKRLGEIFGTSPEFIDRLAFSRDLWFSFGEDFSQPFDFLKSDAVKVIEGIIQRKEEIARLKAFRKYFIKYRDTYSYLDDNRCLVGQMFNFLNLPSGNYDKIAKFFGFKDSQYVLELMYDNGLWEKLVKSRIPILIHNHENALKVIDGLIDEKEKIFQ